MKFELKQLSLSLKQDGSDKNIKKWVELILNEKVAILDLVELLEAEKPVPMRFMWLIGSLCEQKPEVVYPAIPYFFSKQNSVQVPNYNRCLAKQFYLAGIPEELEGEAVDALFSWLMDSWVSVYTKHFALLALYDFTTKHPELRTELKTVIEDQLNKPAASATWKKKARLILQKMDQSNMSG